MNNELELVILAGSAGSFTIIMNIVKGLPVSFDFPILIIIHRNYSFKYNIDDILAERSNLLIREIRDKEEILNGVAYLAPPNYHVLIEKEKIFSLDISEKVLHSRPSIDVSFESAAEIFKDKILAVLFSGASADGAEGLLTIKNAGGITIVQDPEEASFKIMPNAAISINAHQEVLTIEQIIKKLEQLKRND